jgi:hypothetical protein
VSNFNFKSHLLYLIILVSLFYIEEIALFIVMLNFIGVADDHQFLRGVVYQSINMLTVASSPSHHVKPCDLPQLFHLGIHLVSGVDVIIHWQDLVLFGWIFP